MNELKLYYSLVSGDIYHIASDEINNLDRSQIPLVKRPSSSCKTCYGRFYMGFDPKKKCYVPCPKCMNRCVDWDALKADPVVETPKEVMDVADKEFIRIAEESGIEGI